jgi:predicted dehydrogenase
LTAFVFADRKVRLALCGGGRIGRVHLNDILTITRVQLVAVVEPIESVAKEMGEQANCKVRWAVAVSVYLGLLNPSVFYKLVLCDH